MADEPTTTTTDEAGIMRTPDGTMAEPGTEASSQSTTQEGTSLLNQKTEEGKTEPEKKEAEGEKKPDAKEGVPKKYEYTLPEGYTLDPKVQEKADALFKAAGLNQEQAQSLVDLYRETTTEAFQQPFKAWEDMNKTWTADTLSRFGDKMKPGGEMSVRIAKFLDGFPDQQVAKDFRQHMDLTGAGNYYAFAAVLDYAAQKMTEGTHVSGKGPSTLGQSEGAKAPPSAAQAMYPNLKSNS